ncbi:2919_t:CDS:2 [Ambispora leptoticha]|uniref:2919_t:CDS:1 n=1 Tax=Ambispora leptoticha TaxID=144679 RepID=A0A9N9AUX6_9GLOM|nr:2919_t:CDS:2 [Ambispora leptoticha]
MLKGIFNNIFFQRGGREESGTEYNHIDTFDKTTISIPSCSEKTISNKNKKISNIQKDNKEINDKSSSSSQQKKRRPEIEDAVKFPYFSPSKWVEITTEEDLKKSYDEIVIAWRKDGSVALYVPREAMRIRAVKKFRNGRDKFTEHKNSLDAWILSYGENKRIMNHLTSLQKTAVLGTTYFGVLEDVIKSYVTVFLVQFDDKDYKGERTYNE